MGAWRHTYRIYTDDWKADPNTVHRQTSMAKDSPFEHATLVIDDKECGTVFPGQEIILHFDEDGILDSVEVK